MEQAYLSDFLRTRYGIHAAAVRFLREGGGTSYLAETAEKDRFFLKLIGPAFAGTARRSASVMRYLEEQGFPVPKTLLTTDGAALPEIREDGETRLLLVQEFMEGEEPDLTARAEEVGMLTARLHDLLEEFLGDPVTRGKAFFIGRYLDFLRKKRYPRLSAYEELGGMLWSRTEGQPTGICHGDLHRGNLLETSDGRIVFLDFDTVCRAPLMFDVSVMCDMTDYFRLKQKDVGLTKTVYERFLSGYAEARKLTRTETASFSDWIAIRHFQLQATILELYGIDCIDEAFIDRQLEWLTQWLSVMGTDSKA